MLPSALLTLALAGTVAGAEPVAPDKFIPTFAIKYGSTAGWAPLEEAARFDLLLVSASPAYAQVHATAEGNTWQRLKALNPDQVVVQYELGPGEYNTASWGNLGDGWEWVKQHHGRGSADRWVALGAQFGEYLEARPYANERLMLVGNPNWQQYWLEAVEAKIWGQGNATGVDGLFADNTRYQMIWQGQWLREGHRDQPDVPADYYPEGQYQPELWKQGTRQFLARAVPWLAARGRKLVLNYGDMPRAAADWADLDAQPQPVFGAMEEGAYVHPWGRPGFNYRSEEQWLTQVRVLQGLRHVRALMTVHGPVVSDADDLTRMDASDVNGVRAWDVLWYSLTSFLQGYDDQVQNGYFGFTVWGYSRFHWLPEFDPAKLHLGRARGAMQRLDGATGHVWFREFEDGWVVTNPTTTAATGLRVPAGRARVLAHDTFGDAGRTSALKVILNG